ncbi:MAG: hypothetical protein HQL58_04655 [Magnetococcales bacterium]|nr:hypothetical protein [Magnetococcales bacterium]
MTTSSDIANLPRGSVSTIPVYDPNATKTASNSVDADSLRTDFMRMLTAQLQYQDPLEPMQNSDFTNQLAQMNSLQEQQHIGDVLDKLLAAQTGGAAGALGQINQAVSYIGRQVVVPGRQMQAINGQGTVHFNLSDHASAQLTIYDGNGNVVKEISNQSYQAGDNEVAVALPDGLYRFAVTLDGDSAGEGVTVTPMEAGIVTGVSKDSKNQVVLSMNGHTVPLDQIVRVEMVNL